MLSTTPLHCDFLHPFFLDLHFCLPQCCSNHQLCGRLGVHKELTKMEKRLEHLKEVKDTMSAWCERRKEGVGQEGVKTEYTYQHLNRRARTSILYPYPLQNIGAWCYPAGLIVALHAQHANCTQCSPANPQIVQPPQFPPFDQSFLTCNFNIFQHIRHFCILDKSLQPDKLLRHPQFP